MTSLYANLNVDDSDDTLTEEKFSEEEGYRSRPASRNSIITISSDEPEPHKNRRQDYRSARHSDWVEMERETARVIEKPPTLTSRKSSSKVSKHGRKVKSRSIPGTSIDATSIVEMTQELRARENALRYKDTENTALKTQLETLLSTARKNEKEMISLKSQVSMLKTELETERATPSSSSSSYLPIIMPPTWAIATMTRCTTPHVAYLSPEREGETISVAEKRVRVELPPLASEDGCTWFCAVRIEARTGAVSRFFLPGDIVQVLHSM